MEKRRLLVVIMLAFAFSLFLVSAKTIPIDNQSSCEKAQGEWQYISPENAESRFQCVCNEFINGEQIKLWNGTSCTIITDEMRCIKTQGEWGENKCICKNGEWVNGYGCNYQIHNSNYLMYLIIAIVVLLVFIILLILWRRNHGKKL